MIFSIDSIEKKIVRMISASYKNKTKSLSGLFNGLSKARSTLEIAIRIKMNPSKYLLFTNLVTIFLNVLSSSKKNNEFPSQLILLVTAVSYSFGGLMILPYINTANDFYFDNFADLEGDILLTEGSTF